MHSIPKNVFDENYGPQDLLPTNANAFLRLSVWFAAQSLWPIVYNAFLPFNGLLFVNANF